MLSPFIPSGWSLIQSKNNTTGLYKKSGESTFVQWVDLAGGAKLKFINGAVTTRHDTAGSFGGADHEFLRVSMNTYWNYITDPNKFSIVNAQFFRDDGASSTELAFAYKTLDDEGFTVLNNDGYGNLSEYPNRMYILGLVNQPDGRQKAKIERFNDTASYRTFAERVIVSIDETVNKSNSIAYPRCMIGIRDGGNTVLILNTTGLTSKQALDTLTLTFGAEKFIILDSGGSVMLRANNTDYITTTRTIPQAITVIADVYKKKRRYNFGYRISE